MSIISGLQNDFTGTLILLLYRIPAVLIALTLHEVAHGYVALKCGDPTAQMMGRLSLNPLKHLSPLGTVMMLLFGFGFARPVPVNPRNFKRYRRDDLLVSIAGVTMNFLLFFLTTWLMFGVNEILWNKELWSVGELTTRKDFLRFDGWNFYSVYSGQNQLYMYLRNGYVYYSTALDEATGLPMLMSFLRVPWLLYIQRFLMIFSMINLSLCLFNLLPIPPLDGYHVVNDIFLRGKLHVPARVVNVLAVAMLVLFYFTGFASRWLMQAVNFIQGGIVNGILMIFGLG